MATSLLGWPRVLVSRAVCLARLEFFKALGVLDLDSPMNQFQPALTPPQRPNKLR